MDRIITPARMVALGIVLLSACKSSISQPSVSHGLADFTKYVSIGNSLTAGYADGGLYLDGQLNAYPSINATQLKAAVGGVFTQPLFAPGQENGSGLLKLAGFNPTKGVPIIVPVVSDLVLRGVSPLTGLSLDTKFTTAINNLGVPGIRMSDLADSTYGAKNPYLEQLETSAEVGVMGYPAKVLQAKPTFFTSWLGNNDALQFATSGGTYPPLTPVSTYASIYAGFISKLVATGAKGILGTNPNIA